MGYYDSVYSEELPCDFGVYVFKKSEQIKQPVLSGHEHHRRRTEFRGERSAGCSRFRKRLDLLKTEQRFRRKGVKSAYYTPF